MRHIKSNQTLTNRCKPTRSVCMWHTWQSGEHRVPLYVCIPTDCLIWSRIIFISEDFPQIPWYLAHMLLGKSPITALHLSVGKLGQQQMATIISCLLCEIVETQLQVGRYILPTCSPWANFLAIFLYFFIWAPNLKTFYASLFISHQTILIVLLGNHKRDFYP